MEKLSQKGILDHLDTLKAKRDELLREQKASLAKGDKFGFLKNILTNKWTKIGAVGLGLGYGGKLAIDHTRQGDKNIPAAKVDVSRTNISPRSGFYQRPGLNFAEVAAKTPVPIAPKLETSPTNTPPAVVSVPEPTPEPAPVVAPAAPTNMPPAAVAEPAPAPKPSTPTLDEIRAELEKKFAEEREKDRAALSNELVKAKTELKASITPPPAPKTHDEIVKEIVDKVNKGEPLTREEGTIYYSEMPRLKLEKQIAMEKKMAELEAQRVAAIPKSPEYKASTYEGTVVHPYQPPAQVKDTVNTTEGGVVHPYNQPVMNTGPQVNTTEGGVVLGYNPPMDPSQITVDGSSTNIFNLSDKMLEKVDIVYDDNLDQVFPDPTVSLRVWGKLETKDASGFMGKSRNNIPKDQVLLWDYTKKLKDTTKLTPKSGETIKGFIRHALEKAAKDKKLDEVKLDKKK